MDEEDRELLREHSRLIKELQEELGESSSLSDMIYHKKDKLWVKTLDGKEYILFPMYHPAATIYNQKLKETFISDLKKLANIASI